MGKKRQMKEKIQKKESRENETSTESSSSRIRKMVKNFKSGLRMCKNSATLSTRTEGVLGMQTGTVSKNDSKYMCILFDEIIIYEILTRVPLESLIKWRCVCKEWSNLIFNSSFVYLHSRQSTFNYPGLIFNPQRYHDDKGKPRFTFVDIHKKETKAIRFPRDIENDFLGKEIKILQSLNGLLLISCSRKGSNKRTNHVYNPITGRSVILPVIDLALDLNSKSDRYLSLGYDSIMSKYKAVYCGYGKNDYLCKIIDINVSEVGSCNSLWRDVVFPKSYHHFVGRVSPVFVNGCLHWSGLKSSWNLDTSSVSDEYKRRILSLDVSREIFYTTQYPKCRSARYAYSYTLVEMRGLLCYIDHVSASQLKFWILKNKDEWVDECSIDIRHFRGVLPISFTGGFHPLAIHSTDTNSKMIFRYSGMDENSCLFNHYYYYDMEKEHMEFILENSTKIIWHVNSLACF